MVGTENDIFPQLAASSSAGGARPKVVVALRESDGTVVYGASHIPEGFTGWLVKLAALKKGAADMGQYGRLEYAYSLMAKAAGIEMPDTKLLTVPLNGNKVGLFATRRFDRMNDVGEKQKRHVQTFAALRHIDFGMPVDASELLNTTKAITRDMRQTKEAFRRIAFNVTGCNFDDHSKNFAFMMDVNGDWKLAPGYDLTYSMGWEAFRAQHMMRVNGSGRPNREDLLKEAEECGISNGKGIVDQVYDAVSDWLKWAKQAGVTTDRAKAIKHKIDEYGLSRNKKSKSHKTFS